MKTKAAAGADIKKVKENIAELIRLEEQAGEEIKPKRAVLNSWWSPAAHAQGVGEERQGHARSPTWGIGTAHDAPTASRYWLFDAAAADSANHVPSPGRSQRCHALAEPRGYRGSQEDTKKTQFRYRRNHADTTGHERTRH
jgi:hypothetical protein